MKRVAAVLAGCLAIAGGSLAASSSPRRASACPAELAGANDLGRFAFVRGGRLDLLEVASCRVRTLVAKGAGAPVRWSADGRYVAYGRGAVVASAGGAAGYPLGRLSYGWGTGSPGWVWSPSGHRLAGVTAAGGVVVGGPGSPPRRLLPDGWGATSVAFARDGRELAVSRSLYLKVPPPYHQEIWLLDLATGRRRLILQLHKPAIAPPWLYGFSPDDRWVIAWEDASNSSSIAADGLPLVAVPVAGGNPVAIGRGTLVYSDFLSWCGSNLAYVLNRGGRFVTLDDRIGIAGPPPRWPVAEPSAVPRSVGLSFNSPACSPPGTFEIAAAAGPSVEDTPFGHEHRRIWLLGYTGGNWHPLGPAPPAGTSDELPLWSKDGRWIAFVRTAWSAKEEAGFGRLYLLALGPRFTGSARLVGPIADLGGTWNYYGHYAWAGQLAWDAR